MSDRVYIGQKVARLETSPQLLPITQVVLQVDDEVVHIAGSITDADGNTVGRTLEAFCPYATAELAQQVLAKVNGFIYRPYLASDAFISPAAELGDTVTINGQSFQMAAANIIFDGLYTAEISAPSDQDIDHEYPYVSPAQREVNRKIAQTRSLISKTANEIRLEVERINEDLTENYAKLSVVSDMISSEVSAELYTDDVDEDGNPIKVAKYSTVEQTTESITAAINGLDGKYLEVSLLPDGMFVTDDSGNYTKISGSVIETDSLQLSGVIAFGDLSDYEAKQQEINDAYSVAEDASIVAQDASDKVSAWSYNGGTYIDGTKIVAGTVMASNLLGGSVGLLNANEGLAGELSITGASSADFAVDLTSYGSLRFTAESGNIYIDSSGYDTYIMLGYRPSIAYGAHFHGHVVPYSTDEYYCGSAAVAWAGVYSSTSVVVTSDKNKKHSIENLPRKYVDMVLWLVPKRFKLDGGTSDRYHVGFTAQDVEEGMALFAIDSLEFGGWVKDKDQNGNDIYMLRYEEFIAILLAAIQDHEARIKNLEGVLS